MNNYVWPKNSHCLLPISQRILRLKFYENLLTNGARTSTSSDDSSLRNNMTENDQNNNNNTTHTNNQQLVSIIIINLTYFLSHLESRNFFNFFSRYQCFYACKKQQMPIKKRLQVVFTSHPTRLLHRHRQIFL